MAKVAVQKLYTEEELTKEVCRRARCILTLHKATNATTRSLNTTALSANRRLKLTDDEVAELARTVADETQYHDGY